MFKILLVEDETILRETYYTILSTQPYEIVVAANGQEALEFCDKINFDLVLLDLMMPVLNGVEFLEKFDFFMNNETKVIVISNLSTGNMLDNALELGAYKSVVKSELSPRQLLSLVQYEVEALV